VDAAWIRAQAASRYDHAVVAGRLRTLYDEALQEAGDAAPASIATSRLPSSVTSNRPS
jgi:hypothetical protein